MAIRLHTDRNAVNFRKTVNLSLFANCSNNRMFSKEKKNCLERKKKCLKNRTVDLAESLGNAERHLEEGTLTPIGALWQTSSSNVDLQGLV